MSIPIRWFLDADQSGHWYLVPVDNAAEWQAWSEISEDDERSWTVPSFARPIDGGPGRITFVDPIPLWLTLHPLSSS